MGFQDSSWNINLYVKFGYCLYQRIKYKLGSGMTVYKCLHVLAPTYLADDCLAISAIAGKRHLRSAGTGLLSVPRTRTHTLGMRSFAVAGPFIWNSLPAAPRSTTLSPLTFARHLKARLFGWSTARLRTIYDALYKSTHHHPSCIDFWNIVRI